MGLRTHVNAELRTATCRWALGWLWSATQVRPSSIGPLPSLASVASVCLWPLASSLPGLSPLVASAAPLGFFQVVWFDMAALNHCALRPPAAGLKDNVLSHALAIEEVLERNETGLVVLCAVQVLLVACLAPTYQLLQKP